MIALLGYQNGLYAAIYEGLFLQNTRADRLCRFHPGAQKAARKYLYCFLIL